MSFDAADTRYPAAAAEDRWLRAVRVAHLLSGPVLAAARVVGGADGLEAVVRDVRLTSQHVAATPPTLRQGALLVLDANDPRLDGFRLDIALRAVHDAGGSGVLVCARVLPAMLATARLADKLSIPLLTIDADDPLRLCDDLRAVVTTPDVTRSRAVLGALASLRQLAMHDGLQPVLDCLAKPIDGAVWLLAAGAVVVAGPSEVELPDLEQLPQRRTVLHDGDDAVVLEPVRLALREPPSFWLAARLRRPSSHRLELAADLLSMANGHVVQRLVAERLERERDARFRMSVLEALVVGHGDPDPLLLEQLAVLGWRFDDGCTAIRAKLAGAVDDLATAEQTDELRRLLQGVGLTAVIVERSDGWSMWSTQPAVEPADLVARLERVAESFMFGRPGLRLAFGVGPTASGLDGFRASLAAADDAAIIAAASEGPSAVLHRDSTGLRRVLLGWYGSTGFAQVAGVLLGPLLAIEGGSGLLDTLEVYLDCESSATVTADRLGIHRNTVVNRIDRIRTLLLADLDDPEERLAVHLACRAWRAARA